MVSVRRERPVLEEFKQLAFPYVNNIPENDWEWLAVAQHYGLPTRMMDWTRNPIAAAYFAYPHNKTDSDSAIYVINDEFDDIGNVLHDNYMDKSPFSITSPMIFNPRHTTPRITNQSGLLTVHPNPDIPFDNDKLCKWIIKKECMVSILSMVGLYGVHDASMFPGLEGIANLITSKYGL